MEYVILNLFVAIPIVLLWHRCIYNPADGYVKSTDPQAQEVAEDPTFGIDSSALAFSAFGEVIVDAYQRVLTGIALPIP